jgi:hypothetical protein
MFAFREAAAKAGMHASPEIAAHFYRALASEVETACESGRLVCSRWLPPLVPAISDNQWRKLPETFLRGILLAFYVPPPTPFDIQESDLNTPDSAAALAFLNQPYHWVAGKSYPPETSFRRSIRATTMIVLQTATKIYQTMTVLGLVSLITALVFWPRKTLANPTLMIIIALYAAVLVRAFLLALIEISSFPAVFNGRMVPAMPLAIVAALLSVHLIAISTRDRWWPDHKTSDERSR